MSRWKCPATPKRLPTFCRTCFTAAKSHCLASCPPQPRSIGTRSCSARSLSKHLRPRNVRNMVQNDSHDSKRSGYFTSDHAPLPLHSIQGSDRADEIRQLRQERAELELRKAQERPWTMRMTQIVFLSFQAQSLAAP